MTAAGTKKEKKKKTGTIKPSKSKGYYIDGIYVDPHGPGRGVPTSGRLPDARFKKTGPLIEESRELSKMAGINLESDRAGSKVEKKDEKKFITFIEESKVLKPEDKKHYVMLVRSGRADLPRLRDEVKVKIREGHERKRVADKKLVADLTAPLGPGPKKTIVSVRKPIDEVKGIYEVEYRRTGSHVVAKAKAREKARTLGIDDKLTYYPDGKIMWASPTKPSPVKITPSGMVIPLKPTVVPKPSPMVVPRPSVAPLVLPPGKMLPERSVAYFIQLKKGDQKAAMVAYSRYLVSRGEVDDMAKIKAEQAIADWYKAGKPKWQPGIVAVRPAIGIKAGPGLQPPGLAGRGRTPLDKRTYDVSPWKERPGKPMAYGGKLMTSWYGEWVEREGNLADKRHWRLGQIRKDAVSKFETRFKTEAKKKGWVDPSLRRPSVTALESREAKTVLEKRRVEAERGMVTGKRGKKYDPDLARKLSEAKIKRGEVVVERGKTWIVDPVSGERVLAPKGMRVTAPAAKEVARLERKSVFKPMTEEQREELQRSRDLTFREIERQAALYTDRMKAARFMASAMKGRTKKFPTHGYSIPKIEQAYRKKVPRGMWKIKIRRDRPREMIYIKIIAPNTYVNKKTGETITTFPYSSSIEDEVVKILTLHGMVLYPGEEIVSHRRPKVGKGFINLHLRAKVYKPSEQRVRP